MIARIKPQRSIPMKAAFRAFAFGGDSGNPLEADVEWGAARLLKPCLLSN